MVIRRVISRVAILITHIRGLITPLITSPEPPSTLNHIGDPTLIQSVFLNSCEEADSFSSKALSHFLRHGAQRANMPIGKDGYVALKHVLKSARLSGLQASAQEVLQVVSSSDKARFERKDQDSTNFLRATQGHSTPVDDEQLLRRLTLDDDLPLAIHRILLPKALFELLTALY